MALIDLCTKENFAWSNGNIEGYWVDGLTIFRRQIPLAPAAEARLMAEYGLGPDQRKNYYQAVAKAIQHEIAVTNRLKELSVKSTLAYIAAEQAKCSFPTQLQGLLCDRELLRISDRLNNISRIPDEF